MGKTNVFPIFFAFLYKNRCILTKGKTRVVSHKGVDKMLNAFTMHYFFSTMLSKIAVTMPFGTGAFLISTQKTYLIHLFINQINSL